MLLFCYMEPEKSSLTIEKVDNFENLKKITPLSKYLALVLFIILPFLGGYIGYNLAPEIIIEIEKVIVNETDVSENESPQVDTVVLDSMLEKEYRDITPKGWSGPARTFFSSFPNDNTIYTFTYPPMSGVGIFTKFSGIDVESLEYVGSDYFKDKNKVIYNGYYGLYEGPRALEYANPETFVLVPMNEDRVLATDKDSVYFDGMKLEGINPMSMKLITVDGYGLSIVRDEDTVWLPAGDCHIGVYREGTLEEIDGYQHPC